MKRLYLREYSLIESVERQALRKDKNKKKYDELMCEGYSSAMAAFE